MCSLFPWQHGISYLFFLKPHMKFFICHAPLPLPMPSPWKEIWVDASSAPFGSYKAEIFLSGVFLANLMHLTTFEI
jgi:hypothetical protein